MFATKAQIPHPVKAGYVNKEVIEMAKESQ